MKAAKRLTTLVTVLIICCSSLSEAEPIDTVFSYEGYFRDGNRDSFRRPCLRMGTGNRGENRVRAKKTG